MLKLPASSVVLVDLVPASDTPTFDRFDFFLIHFQALLCRLEGQLFLIARWTMSGHGAHQALLELCTGLSDDVETSEHVLLPEVRPVMFQPTQKAEDHLLLRGQDI